ncbi:MAG: hypothetical protein CSA52_02735 [Gammaproteobacteria bacterium]|nr:MAG: hypothetical protein CSB48_04405 [Pseudomonadota bacterium]PIE38316.1 MAG: hypothetical protein CSA52_02735 [Gammaproteobacteria bacterium]
MTTLESQKLRLEKEMNDALEQIRWIKRQPSPDFNILNYYSDLVVRNRHLLEILDSNLFGREKSQQAK